MIGVHVALKIRRGRFLMVFGATLQLAGMRSVRMVLMRDIGREVAKTEGVLWQRRSRVTVCAPNGA